MCQEHVLFSWRLLLIDLVMLVYLLGLFVVLLRLGINITPVVVTNALFE